MKRRRPKEKPPAARVRAEFPAWPRRFVLQNPGTLQANGTRRERPPRFPYRVSRREADRIPTVCDCSASRAIMPTMTSGEAVLSWLGVWFRTGNCYTRFRSSPGIRGAVGGLSLSFRLWWWLWVNIGIANPILAQSTQPGFSARTSAWGALPCSNRVSIHDLRLARRTDLLRHPGTT